MKLLRTAICAVVLSAQPAWCSAQAQTKAAAPAPAPVRSTVVRKTFSAATVANSALISITAPTNNTDGTTITVPLSYNILQGSCGAEVQIVTGWTALTYQANPATLLPGTTVCWRVDAVEGTQTGALSNEGSKSFAALPEVPNAPVISVQ